MRIRNNVSLKYKFIFVEKTFFRIFRTKDINILYDGASKPLQNLKGFFYNCCDLLLNNSQYSCSLVFTQNVVINITIKCQLSKKTLISFTIASLIYTHYD